MWHTRPVRRAREREPIGSDPGDDVPGAEPSTGLSHRIKQHIFQAVARIRREAVALLPVEQEAASTFEVADRVYILEQGRVALEGPAAALARDPVLRKAYLGVG